MAQAISNALNNDTEVSPHSVIVYTLHFDANTIAKNAVNNELQNKQNTICNIHIHMCVQWHFYLPSKLNFCSFENFASFGGSR